MDKKMKVTMLIDTIAIGGGAERQFVGLAVALNKAGYDVDVIFYHPDEGYQTELKNEGVKYYLVKNCKNKISKIIQINKKIKEINPDIVISFKPGANSIACILKALGAKWKLIVSDRNTIQSVTKSIKVQYKLLYRFADSIVPNSYSQKEFIINNFQHLKNKITVISNFTDTNKFHPVEGKKVTPEKNSILIVARIAKQKNVLNFLETVKIHASKWRGKLDFVWYGAPNVNEEEYFAQCESKIKEYNLYDLFRFEHPVKNIEEVYRQFDFFCLPSLWEGFPNALCEAMASGLVVIASRICDNEQIIEHHHNGFLFNPTKIEEMASVIEGIVSLTFDEKNMLAKNAHDYVVENLSINIFTKKYITLIAKLVGNRN